MKKITLLLVFIIPFFGSAQVVTNGTFSSDVSSWTDQNGAAITYDAMDGGVMKIVTVATTNSGAKSSPNTSPSTEGKYKLSFRVKGADGTKVQGAIYQADSGGTESGSQLTLDGTDWQEYSHTFVGKDGLNVDATSMNVRVIGKTESSTYYVDDVKFELLTTESTYVTNGDFEATVYDDNWTLDGSDVALSSATGNGGGTGAAITFSADQSGAITFRNDIHDFGSSVSPTNITVSYDAKASSTAIQFQAVFKTYDGADAVIETATTGAETMTAGDTWETLSFSKALESPFSKMQVFIKIKDNAVDGDVVTVDNLVSEFAYVLGNENIQSIAHAESVTIYPNPVNNIFQINAEGEVAFIEVYDLVGKKVLASSQNSVNVSALNTGMYLVKITFEEGASATKQFYKK